MNPNLADLNAINAFLFREVRHLDDREFEPWLELYAPDAEYWMPAWDDDDQLTDDPHSQISLIYYPNRNGLEDRVFRIKTDRSSASMPEPPLGPSSTRAASVPSPARPISIFFRMRGRSSGSGLRSRAWLHWKRASSRRPTCQ